MVSLAIPTERDAFFGALRGGLLGDGVPFGPLCYLAGVMRMKTAATLAGLWLFAATASGCGGAVQQGPSEALVAYAQALEQGRIDDAYRLLSDEAKRSMSLEAFRRAVEENPDDVIEIARAISRPTGDPEVTATVLLPNGEELLLVYESGRWKVDAAAVDLYGQSTPRQALMGFLRAFDRKRYDIILRYVPDAEKEGLAPSPSPAGPVAEAPPVEGAVPDGPAAAAEGEEPSDPDGGPPPPAPGAPPSEAKSSAATAPGDARLTADKLRAAWEGPQKDQMNRIVQAIKAALPTATIEETGDHASMAYGAGGTVSFIREHGAWKIKDF